MTEQTVNFLTNNGQGPEVKSPEKGTSKRYFTAKQAAEYLNVSRKTIQRIVDAGKCKAYQDGRLLRFRREDLDEYMEVFALPAWALNMKRHSFLNSSLNIKNKNHEQD